MGLLGMILTPGWAASPGSSGADILKMGVSARAIGMGEAYVAQADEVNSLHWNPAGLAFMRQGEASFLYTDLYEGINYQYLAAGVPLENGGIAASLHRLGYGEIDGYDVNGVSIGNQNASTMMGSVGASWLGPSMALGFAVKGIQQTLSDERALGMAYDVGTTFIYPKPVLDGTLRLGFSLQHMGTGLKFIQQRDPFPRQWTIGLAATEFLHKRLNLSLDVGKPRDTETILRMGGELWLGSMVALRTGYAHTHTEGSGIRAGLGVRIKDVSFDYAFTGAGALGMVHRYEFTLRYGEPRPLLTAEEKDIYRRAKLAMRQEDYDQAVLLFNMLIQVQPAFRRAQRYMDLAMARLERQEQRFANAMRPYTPSSTSLEDEEVAEITQLLEIPTPKHARVQADPFWAEPHD